MIMSALDSPLKRKLRWRCRRGMKELDFVLVRFLDTGFDTSDRVVQQNFERLLGVEDDLLWAWVLGRSQPEDAELDALVKHLCGTAAD